MPFADLHLHDRRFCVVMDGHSRFVAGRMDHQEAAASQARVLRSKAGYRRAEPRERERKVVSGVRSDTTPPARRVCLRLHHRRDDLAGGYQAFMPRNLIRCLVQTSRCLSTFLLQLPQGESKLYSVYVPTNHVYVGDIFLLTSEDIIKPHLSVREGLEIVVSVGTHLLASDPSSSCITCTMLAAETGVPVAARK